MLEMSKADVIASRVIIILVMHQGHGTGWLGSRARSGFQDLASFGGCMGGNKRGEGPRANPGEERCSLVSPPWDVGGGRNGDGRIWGMGISTRGICPPLRDNNFSIHPPSEGFSSSGLKVHPKTSISIISWLQPPLQHCPTWSSGIQTIPMGPRRGPQGWKEPLGAEQVSRGAGGLSPSDGPTVVVAFCWSGA